MLAGGTSVRRSLGSDSTGAQPVRTGRALNPLAFDSEVLKRAVLRELVAQASRPAVGATDEPSGIDSAAPLCQRQAGRPALRRLRTVYARMGAVLRAIRPPPLPCRAPAMDVREAEVRRGAMIENMTRRRLLTLAGCAPSAVRAQMAARDVKPVPRDKPTGLPFSRFQNVAAAAGLTAPVIFGGIDRNEYIIEAIGCGAAFLDYDNDGWLDIFLLSGSRWNGAPPGTTNRLYKNNRNGTFTDV